MTRRRAIGAVSAAILLASCGAEPPLTPASPQGSVSTASTLAVTISGPAKVKVGQTCTWTAQVTGGTPPYQYEWISPPYSGPQSITTGFSSPGVRQLWVMVTDANWDQAEALSYVSVGSTSGC